MPMVAGVALPWSLVSFRRVLFLALTLLLSGLLSGIGLAADPDSYGGISVSAIRFEPAVEPTRAESLRALIPLKTGEPFQPADLRVSIQRLYSTGEFANIEADITVENGSLILRFLTTPNYFVGHVAVEGVPEPPSQGQLVTATKLQLGAAFDEREMKQAMENLNDILRRNGFYQATIVPAIERDTATHQVKIRFGIDPGERARFDGPSLMGRPERTDTSVIGSTGW